MQLPQLLQKLTKIMKEIVIEIIRIGALLIGIFFILNYIMGDKTKSIQEKLGKIESNSSQIDSILTIVDSIKHERVQIINNIDRRTTVINQQKNDLNKPLPKDTNIYNAINYLREFSK